VGPSDNKEKQMYSSLLVYDVQLLQESASVEATLRSVGEEIGKASRIGSSRLSTALDVIVKVALAVVNLIGNLYPGTSLPKKAYGIALLGTFVLGPLVQRLFHVIAKTLNHYERVQRKMLHLERVPYMSLPYYLLSVAIGAAIGLAVARALFGPDATSLRFWKYVWRYTFKRLALRPFVMSTLFFLLVTLPIHVSPKYNLHDPAIRQRFATSDDPVKRALAKAYELTVSVAPEFARYKVRAAIADGGILNAFCIPAKTVLIAFTKANLWRRHATEEEITAVALHEFGHALTINASILGGVIEDLVEHASAIFFKEDVRAQILFHLIEGLRRNLRGLSREVLADSFAVRLGYGTHLQSALRMMKKFILHTALPLPTPEFHSTYLPHYTSTKHRIKMIQDMIVARSKVIQKAALQSVPLDQVPHT
jgi:Zn-dependent protease with chaperone function